MANPFEQLDVYECTIEIEVESQKTIQRITAPRFILEQQFVSLVQSAINESRPIRIKLSRNVECYDKYDGKKFFQENSIEFKNKVYVDNEK